MDILEDLHGGISIDIFNTNIELGNVIERNSMVKEYSKKVDGDYSLTQNFKVKEFACKDGSDKILIDDRLVELLQKLRNYTGKPINIISGYRSESYNIQCGGATSSNHLLGKAADVYCKDISPEIIATWAEFNGAGGIGLYLDRQLPFVHIDTREKKYRWINSCGTQFGVSNILTYILKGTCA